MFDRLRTSVLAVAAAALLAGLLAGCGGGSGGGTSGSGSGRWPHPGDQANGLQTLMKASGALDGNLLPGQMGGVPGRRAAVPGDAGRHGGHRYAADLPTRPRSAQLPIKLAGALQGSGANDAILVRADSPIKTVADLKGKTVVVSSARGSIAEYLLAVALQQAGLKYST